MDLKFLELKKASNNKNKYTMVFLNTKTDKKMSISFGAKGYGDYIIYNQTKGKEEADKHKERYINRHQKNENWNEINRGSLSRYILWNKPTLESSLSDFKKRFNL